MNKHVEKARKLRNETPMASNCAQAVLRSYADEIGLNEEQASCIACNFGSGMKCGGVCGAITGGLMVLGAKGVADPAKIGEYRRMIAAKHDGKLDCADLLKANAEKGGNKKEHCDRMIYEAIEAIDQLMGTSAE